jgi:carbamoyl-phosphate synthase large subunit
VRNILVSGASGIVGYGVLRSLKRTNESLNLIGTTIYEDSIAEGFSDIFEKAPLTSDDNYLDWLLEIVKKHNIHFLIPGIEADMYKWVDHIEEIQKGGAIVLINKIDLITLCKDKWRFYESLCEFDSPYLIKSSISNDFKRLTEEFGLPFLIKPRCGYGSKGIEIIYDEATFSKYAGEVGSRLMVQQIVGNVNEEFTTSAFCDGKGSFYCCMTLKRILSKDGFTEKAEVVNPEGIEDAISALCNLYEPIGPTNFQFRKKDGILKLLEINPRISSSTSIRSAFGYNESEMAIDYYLESKVPIQPLIRQGRAVRYVEDFIFYL